MVRDRMQCWTEQRNIGELRPKVALNSAIIPSAHDVANYEKLQATEIPEGLKRISHSGNGAAGHPMILRQHHGRQIAVLEFDHLFHVVAEKLPRKIGMDEMIPMDGSKVQGVLLGMLNAPKADRAVR